MSTSLFESRFSRLADGASFHSIWSSEKPEFIRNVLGDVDVEARVGAPLGEARGPGLVELDADRDGLAAALTRAPPPPSLPPPPPPQA
jgi:hypothetical protein